MSLVDKIVTCIGLIASLAAAGFWLWGSLIEVPDNIDTIVGELQRIGRVNAWAAAAALVAALCAAHGFWGQMTCFALFSINKIPLAGEFGLCSPSGCAE
jgi:hypothetical protein